MITDTNAGRGCDDAAAAETAGLGKAPAAEGPLSMARRTARRPVITPRGCAVSPAPPSRSAGREREIRQVIYDLARLAASRGAQ